MKATNHEHGEGDGNAEDSVLDETTEDYWAGSGSGPEDDDSLHNETREALTHEASDHDAVSIFTKSKLIRRSVSSMMHIHVANSSSSSNHFHLNCAGDVYSIIYLRFFKNIGSSCIRKLKNFFIQIKRNSLVY